MLEACWIFNNEIQFNIDKGTMRRNPSVSQAAALLHVTLTPAVWLNSSQKAKESFFFFPVFTAQIGIMSLVSSSTF